MTPYRPRRSPAKSPAKSPKSVVRYEDGSSYNPKTGKVTRSKSPRPSRRK